jgi:hypothetical protein
VELSALDYQLSVPWIWFPPFGAGMTPLCPLFS